MTRSSAFIASIILFVGHLGIISGLNARITRARVAEGRQAIELPKPDGQFPVGTVIYKWTDNSRDDVVSKVPGEKRKLIVQIWYPATPQHGSELSPYMPELSVLRPAFAQGANELQMIKTDSFADAGLSHAVKRFPVIVFSHGMGVPRSWYTSIMEQLASHGYIVAGIDHPYMGLVAIDGKIIKPFSGWTQPPPGGLANKSDEERDRFWRTSYEQLSADQRFVLDQLAELDKGDPEKRFTDRLNLKRIGLMGHSQGFLSPTCGNDKRIKACLNLEGVPELAERKSGFPQPYMTMRDGDDSPRMTLVYDNLKKPGYDVLIKGAGHNSYLDVPIANSYKYKLNAERAHKIIYSYMLAFFDTWLKKNRSELLNGPSKDFPEVVFTAYAGKKGKKQPK